MNQKAINEEVHEYQVGDVVKVISVNRQRGNSFN